MLVYRAPLPVPAAAVISVAVLPCRAPAPALGAGPLAARHRICLRYADAAGRVRRHRGSLQANLAPGAVLLVAGCQLDGDAVLLSFQPAPRRRAPARAAAYADRFRLPVSLVAWGVTALTGARARLRLTCRAAGGALVVRGLLRLQLQAPAASLNLRVPFIRLLAAPEAPPGLRWRASGGVTGIYLCVKPGGQISGEVVLGLRCDGRPPAPAPGLERVREVTARVSGIAADHAGAGHAVVRGQVEIDIYGFDRTGCSRWTGRSLPFSALLALDGLTEQDSLEPTARIEQIGHDDRSVRLMLQVGLTALRPGTVALGARPYRLERIIGTAGTALQMQTPIHTGNAIAPTEAVRPAFLPLPGPPEGWSELAAALSTPVARAGQGGSGSGAAGRWSVQATLGGTPLDGAPYPAPLRAATGGTVDLRPDETLTAVPALEAVGPAGVHLRTLLCQEAQAAAPTRPVPPKASTVEGSLDLPGECRSISGLIVDGSGGILAMVRCQGAGLLLAEGRITGGGGPPAGALAYPALHGDRWQLRVAIAHAETGAGGA